METLKLNSIGPDVVFLQAFIGHDVIDGKFGPRTNEALKRFQEKHNLKSDGVCGQVTWQFCLDNYQQTNVTDQEINDLAAKLSCEPAAIMAVREIESGGRSPFTNSHRPKALHEGHIFWKYLKQFGQKPELIVGCQDILYPSWTKKYYLTGDQEYDRIKKAFQVSPEAAMMSSSLGMFQIMGFNYKASGCQNVGEFWAKSVRSELSQLDMFAQFITNQGSLKYLRNLDWANFARLYNGPGYSSNQYDIKLQRAYFKYKK